MASHEKRRPGSVNVLFWHSDKPHERLVADAFLGGVRRHGDTGEARPLGDEKTPPPGFDVACMVGVKSRELFHAHQRAGVHIVYLDKGYCRQRGCVGWEYWRVSVDAHHPTYFISTMTLPSNRWDALGCAITPWRERGDHIVIAGSSEKYHRFYGLVGPTEYAQKLVKRLNKTTDRKIIYRPKPSWQSAVPIKGTEFSFGGTESINDVLSGAHLLITHGSNACFEAMLAGIPSLILGNGVARPISSTDFEEWPTPRLAPDADRAQLLWNLAYMQWTMGEISRGEAWQTIRPMIFGR